MSRNNNLTLKIVTVKENTREALFDALRELCSIDLDFSGANGEEYLWAEAKTTGFSNNCDYVINQLKDIKKDIDLVGAFIHEWMDGDGYYRAKEVEVIADSAGTIFFIVLAYVS